jgi:hypothetical protein
LLTIETSRKYPDALAIAFQLATKVVDVVVLFDGVTVTGAVGGLTVMVTFNWPKGICPSKNATTSAPTEFQRMVAEYVVPLCVCDIIVPRIWDSLQFGLKTNPLL